MQKCVTIMPVSISKVFIPMNVSVEQFFLSFLNLLPVQKRKLTENKCSDKNEVVIKIKGK